MTHRDKLTALYPQSAAMRTLQRLVEQRRALVDDKTRITNRLGDALKQYFPRALEWFKDKDTVVFSDFLTRWPTLKDAQRARKARLKAFFYEHNVRYPNIVEQRVQAIRAATALTSDSAVIDPNRLLVEVLVQQLYKLSSASTARLLNSLRPCPIIPCSLPCRVPERCMLPDCWPPSASDARATPAPPRSRNTEALLP